MDARSEMTIGEVARRADVSVATLRFYEERGLIDSERTTGNQRRYPRHVLRRLALISAGQRVGLSLRRIAELLDQLPSEVPSRADWEGLGREWDREVAARIAELEAVRSTLGECIGCGCLSLDRCGLVNPGDEAAREGRGPRVLRRARQAAEDARAGRG